MKKTKQSKNKTKQQSHGVFSFFLKHSQGDKKWFVLSLFAILLSITANFILPQLVSFGVDRLTGEQTGEHPNVINQFLLALTPGKSASQIIVWCSVAIIVVAVISGLLNFVARMGIATGTERFSKQLRDKLFRHVQYLPFKWHVENQTGDIIQRCTSDLDMVRNFVSSHLLEVVRTVILVVVAIALMLSMNLLMTLVVFASIPLIIGYSMIFHRIVGKRFLAADEAEGALTVTVQENLTGVRVVRAFGREAYELKRFDKQNQHFANLWVRLGHMLGIYWGIGDIATGLQLLSVVVTGSLLAANGSITLGEFLVFVSYSQTLAWPVRSLGRTLTEMSKTGVSVGRINEILYAEQETEEPNAKKPSLDCDIRFENVTFCYENQEVLKNLSFTIPKGSTFGILGPTGSGKSTITYLLNRLYELPENSGKIWFGDTEIREIDRQYLRRNVGIVLQEPFLFSKTIQENIAIAIEETNREHIRHSASIAAVDHAIMEFSSGYDTVVGERGVTLSGGQKQRVAIARTLMLKAPVMVFDDSLSAVDLETDAQIRNSLRKDTHGATVVLISHRINTLIQADCILVLEDGKLADIGTHAELISRPGTYQRIYSLQSEAAGETKPGSPSVPAPNSGGDSLE